MKIAYFINEHPKVNHSFIRIHGPDEFISPMGLEDKIHRAAFVVAISDFGRSQLYMRSRHADWPKVKVMHCGVERS